MKAIEVTGLVMDAMRKRASSPSGSERGEERHLPLPRDEALGAGEKAGLDVAVVEEGPDPRQPLRVEAQFSRVRPIHAHSLAQSRSGPIA
jgi:hypothetical protein